MSFHLQACMQLLFPLINGFVNDILWCPSPCSIKSLCRVVSAAVHCNSGANKVYKSKKTRTEEYAYDFRMCDDAVHSRSSKSLQACRNYSFPNLAVFLRCRHCACGYDCVVIVIIRRNPNHSHVGRITETAFFSRQPHNNRYKPVPFRPTHRKHPGELPSVRLSQ